MLEKIGDPLVHLVRNSVDHGIELPDERAAAGKRRRAPELCRRSTAAATSSSRSATTAAASTATHPRQGARARRSSPHDVTPSPQEIAELIFAPGFSTAEVVTDVSGRGVGMDVVRRNVRSLGGDIGVESVRGRGTESRCGCR